MRKNIIIGFLIMLVVAGGGYGIYQTKNLEKTERQLVDATLSHYQQDLIPPDYVISQGLNVDLIKEMTTRATFPIIYSVGQKQVRIGRVVILGKETKGGKDYYVGFTTSCAVTLNHPWPENLPQEEQYNEVIAIKPPNFAYDYYLKEGSVIKDKGLALSRVAPPFKQDLEPLRLSADDKNMWSYGPINKGTFVKVAIEGEWSVSPNMRKCGPEGLSAKDDKTLLDYRITSDYPLGCLLAYIPNNEGKLKGEYYGPEQLKRGFYMPEESKIYFTINDNDRSNNSGKINIDVTCYAGLSKEAMEEMKKTNSVSIKTFQRNDVALVYFPVATNNFFGMKPKQVPSLGLVNPTELVDNIINKSTHLFGFNFFLYCENCDREITDVPEKIKKLNEEWAKEVQRAYERGKTEGVKIVIAGLVRPIMGLISGVIGSGLMEMGLSESMTSIISPVLERLTMTMVLDPVWSEHIKPSLADLIPEADGYLPDKLSDIDEVMPRKISYDEIEKVIEDTVFLKSGIGVKLAGILPIKGKESDLQGFLGNILQSASSLMFVPDKIDGEKHTASLVADDKYINQLLVLEGLAKLDEKDKKFPFKNEFKKSEQKSQYKKKGE